VEAHADSVALEGFRLGKSFGDLSKDRHVVARPFHLHSARGGKGWVFHYVHVTSRGGSEFGFEVVYQIDPTFWTVLVPAERLF